MMIVDNDLITQVCHTYRNGLRIVLLGMTHSISEIL